MGESAAGGSFDMLSAAIERFADDRDWHRYHTPKNLLLALVGEVGELTEVFQWLTPDEAADLDASRLRTQAEDEMADVLIYLIRLAQILDVDLLAAADRKMVKNAVKYPASG